MSETSTIRKVVSKIDTGEHKTDFAYWQEQSYQIRLATLEQIRQEFPLWRYGAQLWDKITHRTPDIRQRQLPDVTMSCGIQPANIRVINRRCRDPASTNGLEKLFYNPFYRYVKKGNGRLFYFDNCQSYQYLRNNFLRVFGRKLFRKGTHPVYRG